MGQTRAHFYDLRGANDLGRNDPSHGSQRLPIHLREPYVYAERLIAQLRADGASRFLDLCCGTGRHSIHPATIGYSVLGVDISPVSIRAARNLAELNHVADRCRFEAGDAMEALARPEQFDVIFISGSLFYLSLAEATELIEARLSEGGHLICVETNGDNHLMNWYRRLRAVASRDRDAETLSSLLGSRGISVIRKTFPRVSVRYFDCATLLAGLLPGRWRTTYSPLAQRVDRTLLANPWLHSLAFKFVIDAPLSAPLR